MNPLSKEDQLVINKILRIEELWQQADLIFGKYGEPLSNLCNVVLILEKYWTGRDRLHVSKTNNKKLSIQDVGGEWRQWTDTDEIKIVRWLQHEFRLSRVTKNIVSQAMRCIAKPQDLNESDADVSKKIVNT